MAPQQILPLQILALISVGMRIDGEDEVDPKAPPTREERDQAEKKLKAAEGKLAERTRAQAQARIEYAKTAEKLGKSIAALELALVPLEKAALEAAERARKAEADEKAKREARERAEELARQKKVLARLKATLAEAGNHLARGDVNVNALKREVQAALGEFYQKADPRMIARHAGVGFDGSVSFDLHSEFLRMTRGGDKSDWLRHFGLVVEDSVTETYRIYGKKLFPDEIELRSISLHEHVTTRIMYDTAQALVRRHLPGAEAPIGRIDLALSEEHEQKHPGLLRAVMGHKVDAFRPSVVNNSTSHSASMDEDEAFNRWMDTYIRGDGTAASRTDNGRISYTLPTGTLPILCNSAGNAEWDSRPSANPFKSGAYPYYLNIGSAEIPARHGTELRDPAAQAHIDNFSSGHAGVFFVTQRPRWQADGTAVRTQYVHPKFAALIEENLWRLAGHKGTPSPADLDDEVKYPPALRAAVARDKARWVRAVQEKEQVDEDGVTRNLRGTSFAAPRISGAVLAARMLYPDASPAEIIDAMCSSCTPITRRQSFNGKTTVDDVAYMLNPATGKAYSPMAGFGEYTIDPGATRDKPDSWMRTLERLEAMKKKRDALTDSGRRETIVYSGEGRNRRKVSLNGQPPLATLELQKPEEADSEASKRRMDAFQSQVTDAVRKLERGYDITLLTEDSPVQELLKKRRYNEMLQLLKTDYVEKNILSADCDEFQALTREVRQAEDMREHAYRFTVHDNQDLCCLTTSLRLKFKDSAHSDRYVVLKSPDGTCIPLIMSDQFGVGMASTPGFMRRSAKGEWMLFTRQEIDENGSQLTLSGTERNPARGIVDVRETVLPAFEREEAKALTLPEKNILPPVKDPHALLRTQYARHEGLPPTVTGRPASSRESHREQLEQLIRESELRKEKYVPAGQLRKKATPVGWLGHAATRMMALLDVQKTESWADTAQELTHLILRDNPPSPAPREADMALAAAMEHMPARLAQALSLVTPAADDALSSHGMPILLGKRERA